VRPIRALRAAAPVAAAAAIVAIAMVAFKGEAALAASIVTALCGVAATFGLVAIGIHSALPASGIRRNAIAAAVVGALGLAWGASALFPPMTFDPSHSAAFEWTCLAMTAGFSALPAVVATLTLRRLYLWSWRRVGAVAFFATAILGSLLAEIICRSDESSHFFVTHVTAIGVVTTFGAWLGGRRWFARGG
jgi:hypothetical protein